jgi:DNA polymerase sigma
MAHTRRRMPYSIGSEKLDRLNVADVKSKLSEDEERKLTTDMRELYDRLLPTPQGEKNRKRLVEKLENLFNSEWPGHDIKVHVFGSSGNLLCTDESDGKRW